MRNNTHNRLRIIVMVMYVCVIGTFAVKAASMQNSFRIVPAGTQVVRMRYQVGSENPRGWTEADVSDAEVRLPLSANSDGEVLYVQQSLDGKHWSPSYRYVYDQDSGGWVGQTGALVLESIRVLGGVVRPFGQLATYGTDGAGAAVVLGTSRSGDVGSLLQVRLAYQQADSQSIWVERFHRVSASVGAGPRLWSGTLVEVSLDVGAGLSVHLAEGDIDRDGIEGLDLFWDPVLHAGMTVAVDIGGTWLVVEPRVDLCWEEDALAFGGGIWAGIQKSL